MRKRFLLFLLTLTALAAFSQTSLQTTWSNWAGAPYGITFRYGVPQDFFTVNPPGSSGLPWSGPFTYGGGTSVAYSDSITGEIKFVATPTMVFNRNYDTVTNGYDLISCGAYDKNAVLVIPFPDGQNKFYIVHQFPSPPTILAGLQTRCSIYSYITGNMPGMRYSILDLDYNNGLGQITEKNRGLPGGGGEEFAQIRHANGKDLWLVGHSGNSNVITRALFNSAGIEDQPMVNVSLDMEPMASTYSSGGNMEASPQGNKIAITSANNRRVNLYNFNKATGDISYDQSILLPNYATELCFSPDGTKLYVSTYDYTNCGSSIYKLFQIDLSAANPQETVFELYSTANGSGSMQMQRIAGNRIMVFGRYLYHDYGPNDVAYHEIIHPNQPQNACNFFPEVFISTAASVSMPNLPNDIYRQNPETPITNFNFPKETEVCFGSYTLSAPAGYGQYRWNTGETTRSITVIQPGSYSVLAGPFGFIKPTAYGYTVLKAKAQHLDLGQDTQLCPKETYRFNIPAGFTNLIWQNGDTSRTHQVSFPGGLQVLTATDANGCRVRDSVCVRMNYYPRAEFGNDTTLCAGEHLTLRMEPPPLWFSNSICRWQDGSTTDSMRITKPGIYWGQVSYQGCTVSDTIRVDFIDAVSISPGHFIALCEGDSVRLTVQQPGLSYQWSTGEKSPSIMVRSAGTYTVWATNGQCTSSDSVVVKYHPYPKFTLGSDRQICPGENLSFTAPVVGNYLWSTGSTEPAITTNQPGLYWLQVTAEGCAYRDTVAVVQKPLPIVNLGSDTTLCEGDTKLLNVFNDGATYQWSNGFTGAAYTITHPETVSVTVNLNGCLAKDTVSVNYIKPPSFTLRSDTVMCAGTSIVLEAPSLNGKYLWQDGSSTRNYTVNAPGAYSLQVSNQCGAWSDSVVVAATLCEMIMPNAFTPNGDGVNDVFRIKFPQYLKSFTMTIYDRRGNKLYETSTPGQGWDGTFRGRELKTETFVWNVKYTDIWNKSDEKWGTVTLIR